MRADKYGYKDYTRQDVINYYTVYSNLADKLTWFDVKNKRGYKWQYDYEYKERLAKRVVIYNFARN